MWQRFIKLLCKTNKSSGVWQAAALSYPVTWASHRTISYRHKPTWTHQKSWLGLVENSRTDSPIPDCQAETKGWELLVLKQKRFGLLGGAPDRFIWNPRGEKTAFIFFIFHLQFASLFCLLQQTPLLVRLQRLNVTSPPSNHLFLK